MEFRLGCRAWGIVFSISGLGRIEGLGFGVGSLGLKLSCNRPLLPLHQASFKRIASFKRVEGLGFGVYSLGLKLSCNRPLLPLH